MNTAPSAGNAIEASSHSAPGLHTLHVPYTYFPDAAGGTEVYVRGLVGHLEQLGYASAVAAPARVESEYVHEHQRVYRFRIDEAGGISSAYGVPDRIAAESFQAILRKTRPAIVHLHARTSAVSELLASAAREAGAKVVMTYHTPTVSCLRGDMMLLGAMPCDGRVETSRCMSCTLQKLGVPRSVALAAACMPSALHLAGSRLRILPERLSVLKVPGLILRWQQRLAELLTNVDHIVAVCDWVRDVLLRNGVPNEKLTLSRHGLSPHEATARKAAPPGEGPLRVAYFGRTGREKGTDILPAALAHLPTADITLDCYVIRQSEKDASFDDLRSAARSDGRIRIREAVPAHEVQAVMGGYDLVAVPSRCLETGPLVVLEAHAAGVPVLGTRLGGIAELVRHEVDGILVDSAEPLAWSRAIASIAKDRNRLAAMRNGALPPRSMLDVARDMAQVYARLGVTGRNHAGSTGSQKLPLNA